VAWMASGADLCVSDPSRLMGRHADGQSPRDGP